MIAALVGALDPAAPWLAPYAEPMRRLVHAAGAATSVAACLNAALDGAPGVALAAGPLRFVGAGQLPPGEAYESFIRRSATVPTRDNLHDLCNGLVWLRFAALKRRLNELHAAQIARSGVGPVRGPLRDALTLFDENGALWAAPPALADALLQRDWATLFMARRGAWNGAAPLLVGHALIEKLCRPRKAITAHVWLLPAARDVCAASGAGWLTPERLGGGADAPLPVLGVPGWWAENRVASFYDDPAVFRPGRSGNGTGGAAAR